MPDLEKQISEWRRQMLAAGIKTPVPLEELESHLREDIERLVKSGLEEKMAFNSAVEKIGPMRPLRREFETVEATKEGRRWKNFETLFLIVTLWLPILVGSLAFYFKNDAFSEMSSSQRLSSLSAAIALSLLTWGMRLSCGKFPVLCTNRIRDAILAPVVLWLVVMAYIIMPHANFTEGQRAVASLWGFAPFGILTGWAWGFAAAARRRTVQSGS